MYQAASETLTSMCHLMAPDFARISKFFVTK